MRIMRKTQLAGVFFFVFNIVNLAVAQTEKIPHFDVQWVQLPGSEKLFPHVAFGQKDFENSRFFTTTVDGKHYLVEVEAILPSSVADHYIKVRSHVEIQFDKNGNPVEISATSYFPPSSSAEGAGAAAGKGKGSANVRGTGTGPGVLGGFGEDLFDAGRDGVQAGLVKGLSVYAYRKLVYDKRYIAKQSALDDAGKAFIAARNAANEEIQTQIRAGEGSLDAAVNSLPGLQSTIHDLQGIFNFTSGLGGYKFQTADSRIAAELGDIRDTLMSSPRTDAVGVNIRNTGLKFTEIADQAYAANNTEEGDAFKDYAVEMADLLFGLDPITGTGRDIYEAFTGLNLITGKELTTFERGMAVFGTATLGYGSKVGRGLSAIAKVAHQFRNSRALLKSVEESRHALLAFKNSKIYQQYRLWRTERVLGGKNPALLAELRAHPKGDVYLKHLSQRQNVTIPHRHNPDQLIEQELSVEALETLDKVSESGWVARQGNFGMGDGEIKAMLKQNPDANVKGLKFGSRVTIGQKVSEHSIHFGEIADDLGSLNYARRHGAYSSGSEFIEISKLGQNAEFITRRAPAGPGTPGGAIEIIVRPGSIERSSLILIQPDTTSAEIMEIIRRRMDQ